MCKCVSIGAMIDGEMGTWMALGGRMVMMLREWWSELYIGKKFANIVRCGELQV